MSQILKFDKDLAQHMEELKKFKEKYFACVLKLNNLQDKFTNALKDLKTAKEREIKTSKLLLNSQHICKQQLSTIENLKLLTENCNEIKNKLEVKYKENEKLHEKMEALKIENDLQLESQSIDFEKEFEKQKDKCYNQIQELQDEISLILASSEIEKKELENEIKNMKLKYEDELNKLKTNNSRLQSTVIIYEKQKHEAEEKCRILEEEKKHYRSLKAISSTKVCDDYVKNTPKYKPPHLKVPNTMISSNQNESHNMQTYFKNAMQNKSVNDSVSCAKLSKENLQNKSTNYEIAQKSCEFENINHIKSSMSNDYLQIKNNQTLHDFSTEISKTLIQEEEENASFNRNNLAFFNANVQNDVKLDENIPKIDDNLQENLNKYEYFKSATQSKNFPSEIIDEQSGVQEFQDNSLLTRNKYDYMNTQNLNTFPSRKEIQNDDIFLKPKVIPKNRRCAYSDSEFSSDSDSEVKPVSKSFQIYRSLKNTSKPQRIVCKAPNLPVNMMPLPIVSKNTKETGPQFPANRKRKLYNPNNYDDLEDFFIP